MNTRTDDQNITSFKDYFKNAKKHIKPLQDEMNYNKTIGELYSDCISKNIESLWKTDKDKIKNWCTFIQEYAEDKKCPIYWIRKYESGKNDKDGEDNTSKWDNRRGALTIVVNDDGVPCYGYIFVSNFDAQELYNMMFAISNPNIDEFKSLIRGFNYPLHYDTSGSCLETEILTYPFLKSGSKYAGIINQAGWYFAHVYDVNGKYYGEDGSEISKNDNELYPRGSICEWQIKDGWENVNCFKRQLVDENKEELTELLKIIGKNDSTIIQFIKDIKNINDKELNGLFECLEKIIVSEEEENETIKNAKKEIVAFLEIIDNYAFVNKNKKEIFEKLEDILSFEHDKQDSIIQNIYNNRNTYDGYKEKKNDEDKFVFDFSKYKCKIRIIHIQNEKIKMYKKITKAHFLRFVHPINYFLVPSIKKEVNCIMGKKGRSIGEYDELIRFANEKMKGIINDPEIIDYFETNAMVKNKGRISEEKLRELANKEIHICYGEKIGHYISDEELSDLHIKRDNLDSCIKSFRENVKENAILVDGTLKSTSKFDSNSTYYDVYDWIKGFLKKLKGNRDSIELIVISEKDREDKINIAIKKILSENKEITRKDDLITKIKESCDSWETKKFIIKIINACVKKEGKYFRCNNN